MRLKYSFETTVLDDQTVAVPVGENASEFRGVIKLNETATFIFELLKQDITEDGIIQALTQEYDVARDTLAYDVHRYIEEFRKKGLLTE